MTTYKQIRPPEVGFDKPITCQLFEKLRDNPIAAAEGNSPADDKYENIALANSTATLGQKDRLIAFRQTRVDAGGSNSTALGVPFRVNRGGNYNIHHKLTDSASPAFGSTTTGGTITTKVNGSVSNVVTAAAGAELNEHILINLNRRDLIEIELTKDAGDSSGYVYCHSWIYTSNPHTDYSCMYGFINEEETFVLAKPNITPVDIF